MPTVGKTNPRFAAAIVRAARPTMSNSPKKTANGAARAPDSSPDLSSPPASDIEDAPTIGSSHYFHKTSTTSIKQELPSREPTPETGDLVPPIPPESKKQKQTSPKKKKKAVPAKQKAAPPPTPAPPNWEEIYSLVQTMRRENPTAPVDTMGCEHLHSRSASPIDRRFQTLISLMLSSQTKDTVNAVAMEKLHTQLPTGLNLNSILEVEPAVLGKLIDVVGFHRRKTEYIKKTAVILRDEWNGDIPDTAEGLMSLPGVGPKMAHLCMSSAWGKTEGIGVDVHVHR
jgi:endonuclease-3